MPKPKLAIVLPCYNEALNLPEIVAGFIQAAARNGFHPDSFRLVIVDNGSTDDTATVLSRLNESPQHQPWLDVVQVGTNQGYGHGLYAGLSAANASYVGWTHADGQCSAEDVFRAYRAAVIEDRTLCMGRREGRPLTHWLFSRGLDLAVLLFLRRVLFDINAQPKVFPAQLVDALENPPSGFAFDLYVLLRARERGYLIRSIPVHFGARKHGQSSWAVGLRSRLRTIGTVFDFILGYSLARGPRMPESVIGSNIPSVLLIALGISALGQTIATRFFFVPPSIALIPRAFIGIGAGYGACCLLLNFLYRITHKFGLSWILLLGFLFAHLVWISRRGLSALLEHRTREDAPSLITIGLLSAVGAVFTIFVWCGGFIGIGHSDKYAMFSKMFLWLDEPVQLSQHYASTLMTAGFHLLTPGHFDFINWVTQSTLKAGLLFFVYSSVLLWSGSSRLLAWFATICFGLVSGGFSLTLVDYIDSGGPVLAMTYPDRIVGFFVVFLWMHWLRQVWAQRQQHPEHAVVRLFGFVALWGVVWAYLAIAVEDLLVLLSLPAFLIGLVLLRDTWRVLPRQKFGGVLAGLLACVFAIVYVLCTQGGLLTVRPDEGAGRVRVKHARTDGEHEVRVHSGFKLREVPGIWYRQFSAEREKVCHDYVWLYGWEALRNFFRITGVGLAALLLLFVGHRARWLQSEVFNTDHWPLRFSFLTLLFPGIFLALNFDDGAGHETPSRFYQWALFLSFLFVGYLVHAVWRRSVWLRPVAVLILGLSLYPMVEYLCRPFMLDHIRWAVGIYGDVFQLVGQ